MFLFVVVLLSILLLLSLVVVPVTPARRTHPALEHPTTKWVPQPLPPLPGAPGYCTGLGAGTGSFPSFHLPVWQEFHGFCTSHLLTHRLHSPAHMQWAHHFHHKRHHAFPMPKSRLLLEPQGYYGVSHPGLCQVLVLPLFSIGSCEGPNSLNSGNLYLI